MPASEQMESRPAYGGAATPRESPDPLSPRVRRGFEADLGGDPAAYPLKRCGSCRHPPQRRTSVRAVHPLSADIGITWHSRSSGESRPQSRRNLPPFSHGTAGERPTLLRTPAGSTPPSYARKTPLRAGVPSETNRGADSDPRRVSSEPL